ncbi:sodium/proline symporter PutP [Ursidibacter maritimus]|uniref:Sodium/proline symporter n=1 Tax=Ursidibacter maritimus TaxID=1331689 RepID=A0A949T7Z7_9PAST|nr:sodium/proline symporter PutP [Ursidibacter maritimus]KAE9541528.1 sodium:proline symporter [Ursidibacter maritimus]MBV6524391.1 sodium/proline symporter PutP [Ursidibacter maritimus]MBV6526071.1 sodium/proline symporter PutP [Ursidibacter maritimus]MBV6528372.1 sodium/proline symporter PutP [Ursidibacter maritimus]MBV6529588.1 sodium/proline symporter PutP [Ursidibacter maritimus]
MFGFDPTTTTFLIYIIGMILIGFIAYRFTHNLSDYILGGRRLGSFVTGLSAGASDMSGWLLMGLPGTVYAAGLVEGWIAIGLTIGAYLNWLFVAGRLRVHTEYNANALTLPDYFHHRFGDNTKVLKIVSASIILFFFAIYCASGVVAGARLFENLFGVPYSTALWYGALATIIYTFIGGFLAVSWTDTIQATLMLFALFLTPIFVLIHLGGFEQTHTVIMQAGEAVNKDFTDLFTGTTFIGLLSLSAWGLGYFGQPHILARFMAADSVRSIPNARRISMIWMIICLFGAVGIGFFGQAYFFANPEQATVVNQNHEQVFIELSKLLFNPWIAGILLSAILAAVMSTLSCQLLICSSAITEDFYKGMLRPNASQKELVWLGRIMVLVISVLAILLAQDPNSKVLGLVSYAWAGFGCAFGPVVILSLFWRRMNAAGAMAGMLTGALVVVFWNDVVPNSGIYEMIPGFILATIAIVVVSLITPAPKATITDTFDKAEKAYHSEMSK